MDLPVIGAHCALPTCNTLDLLPIKCQCDKLFCRFHFSPEVHDCRAAQPSNESSVPWVKRDKCAFESCGKPSLESAIVSSAENGERTPATCPRCSSSFCATHRHPSSHSCTASATSREPKNEVARALLAKNFPAQSSDALRSTFTPTVSKVASQTTNPGKLAQIKNIELMKMRRKAIPGDPRTNAASLDLAERLHVGARLENAEAEKVFWFRKSISTGRALDQLADHFGVKSSDQRRLQLVKVTSSDPPERMPMRNDRLLSEEVEEGSHLLLIEVVSLTA